MTLGASRDNTLYESSQGSVSNGAGEHFFAGTNNLGDQRRGLVHFDLAAAGVPATATVDSVHLTLTMSRSQTTASQSVSLHRVSAAWGEGSSNAGDEEGMGAAAASGDATWTQRFVGGAAWTVPGGDFVAAPSATLQVGGVAAYTWRSTPAMVGDLQTWVKQPAQNHGWIVIGNEATVRTAKRFASRSNSVAQTRPSLTVYYKVP